MLPGCDDLVLPQGQSQTDYTDALMLSSGCLAAGIASGLGAEQAVAEPTSEGDPIVTFLSITPTGRMEVYIDSSWDRFGSGGWVYGECDPPEAPSIADRCEDLAPLA